MSIYKHFVRFSAIAILGICAATFGLSEDLGKDQGITVGQPKVWRYDRIYPLLDGMLQDIESMFVAPTKPLDPNTANLSYVDFLRTLFTLQVDYDQGVGFKNQLAKTSATRQQNQSAVDDDYQTLLKRQRNDLTAQLISAQADEVVAQKAFDVAKPNSDEQSTAQTQLNTAKNKQTALKSQLQDISGKISAPGGTSNSPAFSNADSVDPKAQPGSFSNFLDQLPDNVKSYVYNTNNNASLPASKQMENVVTLLNQRLAQELSVIADDASRNGYELYLFEFDVGLYPPKSAKNKVGRVEFNIGNASCDAERPAYAYALTPNASSYNIQQYIGRSQHFGVLGAFNLLLGLGANAEYQRQHDQFRNGLVQSVYQSGFMNGECSFGWHYGPSPFDDFVSPGNRSSYALIAVSKAAIDSKKPLTLFTRVDWQDRAGKLSSVRPAARTLTIPFPAVNDAGGSPPRTLTIDRISYSPLESGPADSGSMDPNKQLSNTILIVMARPADPNIVVTANGTLLKRARDTRGEAIHVASDQSVKAATPPRGEFESTVGFGPDTWILADPRTMLLKVSQATAGLDFPLIRFGDSSNSSADLVYIVNQSLGTSTEVQFNDKWTFKVGQESPIIKSAFPALFRAHPINIDDVLSASVEEADEKGTPRKIRVSHHPTPKSASANHQLTERAQVILGDTGQTSGPHPLECVSNLGDLVCSLPLKFTSHTTEEVRNALGRTRVSVRDRLRFGEIGTAAVPVVSSGVKKFTGADLEAEGSAAFDSTDVVPHLDDVYESVSLEGNNFVIHVNGRNLKPQDLDGVAELQSCAYFQPTIVSGVSQLDITVGTEKYACLAGRQFGPFHLLHPVSDTPATYGKQAYMQANVRSGKNVVIPMPDLKWAIDQGSIGDLVLASIGGTAEQWNYRLHVQNSHANWVDSITLLGDPSPKLIRVNKGRPDFVDFWVGKDVKKSPTKYGLVLNIKAASIPAFYNEENNVPLEYSFSEDKCYSCSAFDEKQHAASNK